MLLRIYQIISTLLLPFVGIYIKNRIKLSKEDPNRYKERYGKPGVKRKEGNVIWIHAASVGETLSILKVISEIEKIESVDQVLAQRIEKR